MLRRIHNHKHQFDLSIYRRRSLLGDLVCLCWLQGCQNVSELGIVRFHIRVSL